MKRLYLLTLGSLMVFHGTVLAQTNTGTRIALHRTAATGNYSSVCTSMNPNTGQLQCSGYTTTGPGTGPSFVYVVAALADPGVGVAAVSFGIDYDGRDPDGEAETGDEYGIIPDYVNWIQCADGLLYTDAGQYGNWPNPQSSARITWATCQKTVVGGSVHAVVGSIYVYAYSEDVLRITANNNVSSGPELLVQGCGYAETNLLSIYPPQLHPTLVGAVHFGGDGSKGYNPCAVVPVQASSWGRMKTRFSN
jgi:hypothetical protein